MWDARQYLKYANERSRPFFDLLAQVRTDDARRIIDLGCGPGNLTATLVERWPNARVIGVDNSAEMLEQANPRAIPGRLEFVQADVASTAPGAFADLIVSNAALQWVPGHDTLFPRLASLLTPNGTLAVQMPFHFQNPAHLAIVAAQNEPRWAMLKGVGLTQESVRPLKFYVELLHDLGFTVDAWQTTYLHVLTGENPVLEWLKGSALRPLLAHLSAEEGAGFLADVGRRFREAYPARNGVTLFPFPRIFFVAIRH